MERDDTDTRAFAHETSQAWQDWDYCHWKARTIVLGDQPLVSLETISERCGRDARWAYKVLHGAVQRLRETRGE